uniref:RBR-type E3 ubiquitin transferase n=1 Tax=Schistocephalus solidus TaxID=70667 RepID=A0A0X3QCF4_SCHSO
MSVEQIFDLLSRKIPCHKDTDAGALYCALRNEELELITTTYANRLTTESQGDVISGEFTVLPYCSEGVFVVGTGLHRELQYPEICVSQDTDAGSTYLLNRLPTIFFRFYLGQFYPMDPNFSFTLECAWLPSMLVDLLSARLTEEISMFEGQFAVKHCCEFLQNEAMEFLFRSTPNAPLHIDLFQFQDTDEASSSAGGGNQSYRLTDLLVGHEEQARNQEFTDALHECPVCFEELPGTQCIRFRKCRHFACRECAAASFAEQITQSTNACEPTCVSCAEPVRQQEIRAVVTNEQYTLYEQRLLNRTLSSMPDMVACPNRDCNFGHVLLNENRDQGICPSCRFHFCARCRAAFHNETACQTGPHTRLSPDKVAELVARYQQAGVDGRAQMELQYGKANLNQLITEHQSNEIIKTACKRCPNCHVAIQKTTGCNRMRCTGCQKNFCWLCLSILDNRSPYDHFGTRCGLWR